MKTQEYTHTLRHTDSSALFFHNEHYDLLTLTLLKKRGKLQLVKKERYLNDNEILELHAPELEYSSASSDQYSLSQDFCEFENTQYNPQDDFSLWQPGLNYQTMDMHKIHFKNHFEREGFKMLKRALGVKICQALLDNNITEIMLNESGDVYIEHKKLGMQYLTKRNFALSNMAIRIVSSLNNYHLDLNSPHVSGVIPYIGARFEGMLPPLCLAPIFSIRRHSPVLLKLAQLHNNHMFSQDILWLLRFLIHQKANILISGATGCGKTTLINALIHEIMILNHKERIITIEDTKELKLNNPNFVSLTSFSGVGLSDLLRSSLRMRPDRIIIGEVRGAEALDLVDALCTGHKGGIASIHAGNTKEALMRLSLLIGRNNAAPKNIEANVANAIDIVVQINKDGKQRKITHISQVVGYMNGEFKLKELDLNSYPLATIEQFKQEYNAKAKIYNQNIKHQIDKIRHKLQQQEQKLEEFLINNNYTQLIIPDSNTA